MEEEKEEVAKQQQQRQWKKKLYGSRLLDIYQEEKNG